MREIKKGKTIEIIHRLVAKFVQDISSPASLITITRVELSMTGKEAKVFFTTLPEDQEDTALKFLIRKTPEFKKYLRDKSRLGLIPHIDFKIDYGERSRQRLDKLSNQ